MVDTSGNRVEYRYEQDLGETYLTHVFTRGVRDASSPVSCPASRLMLRKQALSTPTAGRIQVLDAAMANQIAAGEVIENPASVVKELVENAIDADARSIRVITEGAATDLIRVIDDGEGMTPDDAGRALERHATSKIREPKDLERIETLGFRGEALPSIASVSRLTLTTKARGEVAGTQLICLPGEATAKKPVGTPEGTRIEVRDLFFNTPARLKFLKSPPTEAARITELVTRLALCRPSVAFNLARNGKQTRNYLARETFAERVQEVVGAKVPLREANGALGLIEVEAWLTGPEDSRIGARALHVLVNGRLVRDQGLLRAIWYAYDGTLDQGHYPLGVVRLTVAPTLVDVNVHPQKAEVRFSDRGAVHGALSRVIKSMIQARASYLKPVDSGGAAPPQMPLIPQAQPPSPTSGAAPWLDVAAEVAPHAGATQPVAEAGHFSGLRFIASAGHAWLICEGPDGLVIIDQHAAHERVTFERLREAFRSNTPQVQQMLVPEQAEVSASELDLLEQNDDQLRAIGFEVEPFSTTSVTITAVPSALSRADPRRLLDEVLNELSALQTPLSSAMDRLLARLACHGSIRGGSRIAREEVEALLRELDETQLGGHCPHGRPVSLHLSWTEVERRLGRQG